MSKPKNHDHLTSLRLAKQKMLTIQKAFEGSDLQFFPIIDTIGIQSSEVESIRMTEMVTNQDIFLALS